MSVLKNCRVGLCERSGRAHEFRWRIGSDYSPGMNQPDARAQQKGLADIVRDKQDCLSQALL